MKKQKLVSLALFWELLLAGLIVLIFKLTR